MTQAFNLSQFANKVNTSGQADLTTAVTGTLPVANGGTGAASLTANNVLLGNGTSAVQVVAPSTSGNVLTSNGTTWTSAAAPSSAPTTAQVQSAMAGSNAGDLGTFNFGYISNTTNISAGTNYAGSTITMTGLVTNTGAWAGGTPIGGSGGATVSGTWKAMANCNVGGAGAAQRAVIFLRVA